MPVFTQTELAKIAGDVFQAAGATPEEARVVGEALAEANVEGHDSHGVVRISEYVGWMEENLINIGAHMKVVKETDAFAVLDGNWGWGQVVAKEAMEYGIQKALRSGAVTISVRQCCHIGRVGDYPLMAARKGLAVVMFVNTHGAGKLVAPWGGRERRLSANPIAIAIPRSSAPPILIDLSTCAIAGGKVTIAYNSGKSVSPRLHFGLGGPSQHRAFCLHRSARRRAASFRWPQGIRVEPRDRHSRRSYFRRGLQPSHGKARWQ